jgi:hypothetical protein
MPSSPQPGDLPEVGMGPITPMPAPVSSGPPAGIGGPPPVKQPTRYEEKKEALDAYLQKTPGRVKSAALNALKGAAQGFATGGGLGAAVGGAVAGGAFGGINPKGAREMEFNQKILPKIQERWAYEDADRAAARQAAADAMDAELKRSQAAKNTADARRALMPVAPKAPAPIKTARGLYDTTTGQIIAGTEPLPKETKASPADEKARIAAQLDAQQGTVEEESQRSMEGRREMLKKHLTPDERRIVEGKITKDDFPDTIKSAHAKWGKIQADELKSIQRDTAQRRKAEIDRRRLGRKGMPGRTAISVSEAADLLK